MTLKFCRLSADGLVPARSIDVDCLPDVLFVSTSSISPWFDSSFFLLPHSISYHRDTKEESQFCSRPAPGNKQKKKKIKNPGRTRCQFHLHWVIRSVLFSFFFLTSFHRCWWIQPIESGRRPSTGSCLWVGDGFSTMAIHTVVQQRVAHPKIQSVASWTLDGPKIQCPSDEM